MSFLQQEGEAALSPPYKGGPTEETVPSSVPEMYPQIFFSTSWILLRLTVPPLEPSGS